MRIIEKQVPDTCDIVLHGDTHLGTRMCHLNGIQRLIRWIKAKPDRYFVHMGDAIEAIVVDDKRFDIDTTDEPKPLKQAKKIIQIYKPVAERGLAWLKGNHEFKLDRVGDLAEFMADELGVSYGTWTCKLRLVDPKKKQICKMFLTHGFRGRISSNAKDYEQRTANMKASLKNKLVHKAGDCLVMAMGHTHLLMVVDPAERLILSDDGGEIRQNYLRAGDGASPYIEPDRRWYVNTGAFLKLYQAGVDGYAERAGYDPVELGYVMVRIKNGKVESVKKVVI